MDRIHSDRFVLAPERETNTERDRDRERQRLKQRDRQRQGDGETEVETGRRRDRDRDGEAGSLGQRKFRRVERPRDIDTNIGLHILSSSSSFLRCLQRALFQRVERPRDTQPYEGDVYVLLIGF